MSPRPKAIGGMPEVLYVRCDAALIAALDREGKRRSPKGTRLSRSDISRALLWEALTPKPSPDVVG